MMWLTSLLNPIVYVASNPTYRLVSSHFEKSEETKKITILMGDACRAVAATKVMRKKGGKAPSGTTSSLL